MADRTALTATVYGPPERAEAITDALRDTGCNWIAPAADDAYAIGETLIDDQAPVGTAVDVAAALEAAVGDHCAFTVTEDPCYEFDGAVIYYTPEDGRWEAGGDGEGIPHVTVDAVDRALDDVDSSAEAVAAVRRLAGQQIRRRMAAYRDRYAAQARR